MQTTSQHDGHRMNGIPQPIRGNEGGTDRGPRKEAEWAYMLQGRARISAVDQDGRNFLDDVGVGDLWYFPA